MRALLAAGALALLCVPAATAAQEAPAPDATSPEVSPDEGGAADGSADDEGGATLEAPAAHGEGEEPIRVAILVLAAPGVDAELADALSEVVIGAVAARGGVSIVGKEEFQAQLGQGEARSMECVSSAACVGRVGVQLGVDEVVAGTVNRRGDTWIFNLNRIDVRSGELAGRAFQEIVGDLGAVAAAIQSAVPGLYEHTLSPATLVVAANVPGAEVIVDGVLAGVYQGEAVTLAEITPGRHEVAVSAPGHFEWRRAVNVQAGSTLQLDASLEEVDPGSRGISPMLWAGGGTLVAGAVLGLAFGLRSQREPGSGATRREALATIDDRERDARVAHVSFVIAGVGAALAVVGVAMSDFDGDEDDPEATITAAALAPVPGGAVLSIGGSL